MILLKYKKLTIKRLLKDYLYVCIASVVIAVLFILVSQAPFTWKIFFEYVKIAQCIGISISFCSDVMFHILKPRKPVTQIALLTTCVVTGAFVGSFAASFVAESKSFITRGQVSVEMLIVGVVLGFVIAYGLVVYDNYQSARVAAKDERLKRLSLEKEKLNAELKLLQAQVEPHFLFNTLSNILSLLDSDVKKGCLMLENLTQYLRSALVQSRKPYNTVKDEIRMVRVYLDIFKIRMGMRLTYSINIPEEMLDIRIPPMILQPLVENAVKHGIEPKIDGGHIDVSADFGNRCIRMSVSDTGTGIQENAGMGVGTGNVKDRLNSLYADEARLYFEDVNPAGLKAVVEIPYEADNRRRGG